MRSARLFRNDKVVRVFRPFWDSSRSQKFGGNSIVSKKNEPDPYEGNFSFTECDQYTKVTIIGAAGRVGRTLSLLLKTCPLVDHLCLFDTDKSVKGIGVDISHIDTKCCVSYVSGMRNIQQALDAPDVVIIAAGCPASPHLNGRKLFDKNAPIVAGLSEACARFCPKACIVLITSPINSLLPVMGEVYKVITNRIPAKKLFGLTTLDVVRANTFVAEVVRKDPNSIIVPVIGGTSQETIVPVISQMKPCFKIKRGEMIALTECLKRAEGNLADCQNCGTRGASSLSTAYAAFRFTSSLVMALKGAEDIIECAFVKSDIIPELEYLASPLKLGAQGVEYNFGYPHLSDYELVGLEQAASSLLSDIELGKTFVDNIEETIRKGLVWKKLYEDTGKTGHEELKTTAGDGLPESIPRSRRTPKEIQAPAFVEDGVRSWTVPREKSLRRWFRSEQGQPQSNGDEISTDLDSDVCRGDQSLRKSQAVSAVPLMIYFSGDAKQPATGFWMNDLFRRKTTAAMRGLHTISRGNGEGQTKGTDNYKRYLMEDRQKTVTAPKKSDPDEFSVKLKAKMIEKRSKKFPWNMEVHKTQYKNMNATAKQKFRVFNNQKKFTPSASVLYLLKNQGRKEPAVKNLIVSPIQDNREKKEKEEISEEKQEEPEGEVEKESGKELIIVKNPDKEESVKYREFVLKQLQELRRENEELKKKLVEIVENKNLESALQAQTDSLELEKTKLKACWLIMSSTMDAFSNFCKKFTSRTDVKLDNSKEEENEENEEFEDAVEDQGKKEPSDEKYYNFLEKLMDDQVESQKTRKRMGK